VTKSIVRQVLSAHPERFAGTYDSLPQDLRDSLSQALPGSLSQDFNSIVFSKSLAPPAVLPLRRATGARAGC
jgi:hypothetical protein